MTNKDNPFIFKEIPIDYYFCNRTKELKELQAYAKAKANVVIYSPRRYGKTSLVKRVQSGLAEKKFITIFVDFFGVTSVEDIASRIAAAVFAVTRKNESIFNKALRFIKTFRPVFRPDETGNVGVRIEQAVFPQKALDLLEQTLTALEQFIKDTKENCHIALDEFQELLNLPEASQIEALLRTQFQKHPISYFFVGSRRHLLLKIFNDKNRPFFQSAINYALNPLPKDELTQFVFDLFKKHGKNCPQNIARSIVEHTHQHPYYTQKLAFFVFEFSSNTVELKNIEASFDELIKSERPVFESILQGLAPRQIALLRALAEEPTETILSAGYMKRHQLGSTGAMQGASKKLI